MRYLALFLILLLIGCKQKQIEIDLSEYHKLPEINHDEITTSIQLNCWQLIYSQVLSSDSIVFSTCHPSEVMSRTTSGPHHGFYTGCEPVICFHYIKTLIDDNITYWATPDSLKEFLKPIDNISEAQLLCNGYDYYSTNKSVFKETDDGYLLTLDKLVSIGMPIQIDRFLLKVKWNGKIVIMGKETIRKIENAII